MLKISSKLSVGIALILGSLSAEAATTLRFSDYGPNRGTRAAAIEWMASELEKRSDGELKIEFFWGGSLLGGRDTLGGVSSGVADMGTIIGFFTPKELQLYNIGDLPVENSDMLIGMRAMYELSNQNDALVREFSDAGVHYVTNYTSGPVQLICREEVKSLSDLEGLKIRASGPYGDTLARLGVDVVRMSQADVYQALDSGLIDCNQNYYYSMEAYRQYEVAPYVLELDWGQNMSFGIAMNSYTYDSLSDENKQVLDSVAYDFVNHLAKEMKRRNEQAKSVMQAGIEGSTITVSTLSDEDRAKLFKKSQLSIEDWVQRVTENGENGQAVLEDYLGLIEKYKKANQ